LIARLKKEVVLHYSNMFYSTNYQQREDKSCTLSTCTKYYIHVYSFSRNSIKGTRILLKTGLVNMLVDIMN